jgi:hypothetical protein
MVRLNLESRNLRAWPPATPLHTIVVAPSPRTEKLRKPARSLLRYGVKRAMVGKRSRNWVRLVGEWWLPLTAKTDITLLSSRRQKSGADV